jgi:hypothetical protein
LFVSLFVSLTVADFRGTFAGFACPFGNVPGLRDSRKRYDYVSLRYLSFFPSSFPSLPPPLPPFPPSPLSLFSPFPSSPLCSYSLLVFFLVFALFLVPNLHLVEENLFIIRLHLLHAIILRGHMSS